MRVKERPEQDEGIQMDGDTITYPFSEQNRHLDRVIQYLLVFIAGIHIEPDHIKDHWKIEAFYNHARKERSLAVQYPELAKEWSEKNEEGPDVVSPGLGKKRWWKCPKCHREYQATVHNRTYHHSSCPYCAHLRATPENCLAAVYPEVASEWDEAKNAPLNPTDVLPGTDKSVWWKCKKGHSWRALIYTRTGPKPTKCPYCQGHAVERKHRWQGKPPRWHNTGIRLKMRYPPSRLRPTQIRCIGGNAQRATNGRRRPINCKSMCRTASAHTATAEDYPRNIAWRRRILRLPGYGIR